MTSSATLESGFFRFGPVQRVLRWLDAMPHPSLVCEIAPTHVAAARWRHGLNLESTANEGLPEGTLTPSPVEPNIANAEALGSALRHVLGRMDGVGQDVALLVPDPVIRVFILPFETFPRSTEEAAPLLRWRLKKSVPFDVEETTVSAMRQTGRGGTLEVVAALARQRIVREYEAAVEAAGFTPGVVLSSTLAVLPILQTEGVTLLARMSGKSLTTVIVHGPSLCVYRTSEMDVDAEHLEARALLDEIYPAVAYFQDSWAGSIGRVRLAGFGGRFEDLRSTVSGELSCTVMPVFAESTEGHVSHEVRGLLEQQLESLIGWSMNRGG